jgi:LPS sulfotransferase NodH
VNLDLSAYIALLAAQGFERFIVLARHNHLRKLVSGIAGKRSGLWHTRTAVRGPAPVPLPVEDFRFGPWRGTLLECLRDLDAQHARLLAELAGRQVLRLSYEEHISDDPGVAYRAVCAFLGLEPRPVRPTLTKTNPFPLRDIVSNWDEVAAVLAGTPYAWMLDADLPPAEPHLRTERVATMA